MSYDDDEEGGPSYEPYEPVGRRRTVAPASNHGRMDFASYRQQPPPPPPPQYTKSGASLKPPPPSSTANTKKASLIDDDSDDDDDPYATAAGGAGFHGVAARGGPFSGGGGGMGMGNSYGVAQGLPVNNPTSWGNAGPAIPVTNGRTNVMPGLGYGYGLPDDDQKGQHKERRTMMQPEQPPAAAAANRKAPPLPRHNSNLYPRKDPPKTAVDTVDFLARLTAQIDQPDEETLMTQHAQKTLLEIQHTTGARGGGVQDEDLEALVNGHVEGQDPMSPTSLPEPTEGRKKVSSIFSRKIQKPLEPGAQSRRLRRARPRQEAADVVTGLLSGNVTMMDHRIQCFACGTSLVTSKSVILVVCPACHCKFPNDRVIGPTSAKIQARGIVSKEYSC